MVVSQFSLPSKERSNLEKVSVRISQRQPGTAYLEPVCIKVRFKDDGSEATRALLRKYSNYSRIAHITTVNLS